MLEDVLRLATLLRHGEGVHPAPHVEEDDVPDRTVATLNKTPNVAPAVATTARARAEFLLVEMEQAVHQRFWRQRDPNSLRLRLCSPFLQKFWGFDRVKTAGLLKP